MEGESTSCRRLNFEGNEDMWNSNFDDIDEGLNIEIDLDIPQMGLEFETEEDAYQFYLAYAKKMRDDYANFGDIVCFDTTYRKNNEGQPIALFVGVNHHKQSILFGAALLYDETSLTFEWLFDTLTRAMGEKKPTTILTNQDAAMAKTDFAKDFASCIYDFDEEEDFISAWNMMLAKYVLEDNDWLRRMLLDDRRYEELKADFKSNTTVPYLMFPIEILKHASEIYTPEVYKCFQQEWCLSHDSNLEICEDVDTFVKYKVTPHKKKNHHIVTLDKKCEKIECSCRKFEFAGILCSHILKIFTWKNIMKIPSDYVLKRWTRKAKFGYFGVNDSMANNASLDPKVLQNMRYKELCGLNVQLVTKAAERDDTYMFVKDTMLRLCKIVDDKLQVNESNVQQLNVSQASREFDYGEGNSTGVKGIKMKKKTVSG
ncbi:protein FAR1-RELATED SEQUENCE 7-like [Zingiber officinale]|uniref:protein FAR1-RELATED SEQUENCE 7-like n=1 Tax=Zingiber officinale TaxID=94328 RepID=UPI001C4AE32C|nr:protein FAR1-RELATED SEQUENCE 7-like [Zingiber officinale]